MNGWTDGFTSAKWLQHLVSSLVQPFCDRLAVVFGIIVLLMTKFSWEYWIMLVVPESCCCCKRKPKLWLLHQRVWKLVRSVCIVWFSSNMMLCNMAKYFQWFYVNVPEVFWFIQRPTEPHLFSQFLTVQGSTFYILAISQFKLFNWTIWLASLRSIPVQLRQNYSYFGAHLDVSSDWRKD